MRTIPDPTDTPLARTKARRRVLAEREDRHAASLLEYLRGRMAAAAECRDLQAVIGAALGLTPVEVHRAATRLQARGLILVDRPDNTVRPAPNRYRLAAAR